MTTPVEYNFETATIETVKKLRMPFHLLNKNDIQELELAALASPLVEIYDDGDNLTITVQHETPSQPIPMVLADKLSLPIYHLIFSSSKAGMKFTQFDATAIMPQPAAASER